MRTVIIMVAMMGLTSSAMAVPAPAECSALQQQLDALYASPKAQDCDGSRDGDCAAFWDSLDAISERQYELGCK